MAGKLDLTTESLEQALNEWSELEENKSWLVRKTEEGQFILSDNGTPDSQDVIIWQEAGKLHCSNPDFGMDFNAWLKGRGNGERKPTRGPTIEDLHQNDPLPEETMETLRDEAQVTPGSIYGPGRHWTGTLLGQLLNLFDSDLLEIFGDTGTGKTIFCQEVAKEAAKTGARVIYIDTEKNIGRTARANMGSVKGYKDLRFVPGDGIKSQVKDPGLYYLYTPALQELSTITRNLPDADLIIIDSLGMPVLVKYSRMKQNEQGHVLQEMIAIKGDLKEWAYRTGGLAIDINQPVSDMNKTPQQIREGLHAFGDKSGFATKSVIRFWKIKDEEGRSVIEGKIHKSRDFGKGKKIIDVEIINQGTKIKILEVSQ